MFRLTSLLACLESCGVLVITVLSVCLAMKAIERERVRSAGRQVRQPGKRVSDTGSYRQPGTLVLSAGKEKLCVRT